MSVHDRCRPPALGRPGRPRRPSTGVHLPVPADGPPHVLVGDARRARRRGVSHGDSLRRARGGRRRHDGGPRSTSCRARPRRSSRAHARDRPAQVDSPAFDGHGRLYVTQSGGRGTKVPVPLYRVGARRRPRAGRGRDRQSDVARARAGRRDLHLEPLRGHVYRLTADDRVELYATRARRADRAGVRARRVAVRRRSIGIDLCASRPTGQVETFASLPASVAAFHLAFGPDGCLYVTAPTLATHDPIYRITPDRLVDVVCERIRPAAGTGVRFDRRPVRRRCARRRGRAVPDRSSRRPTSDARAGAGRAGAGRRGVRSGRRHGARLERHGLAARRRSQTAVLGRRSHQLTMGLLRDQACSARIARPSIGSGHAIAQARARRRRSGHAGDRRGHRRRHLLVDRHGRGRRDRCPTARSSATAPGRRSFCRSSCSAACARSRRSATRSWRR